MARIRSLTARLGDVFAGTRQPAYVLDDQRRIVYCNDACGVWTGVPVTDLVGARCDYHSNVAEPGIAGIVAGLCPPPDTLVGEPSVTIVNSPHTPGGPSRRRAWVIPVSGVDTVSHPHTLVLVAESDLPDGPSTQDGMSEAAVLHDRLRKIRASIGACYRVDQLIGASPAIRRIREQIRLVTLSRARVVILGPPGSGCEHVARTIHYGNLTDGAPPIAILSGPLVDREMLQTTLRSLAKRGPDSPRSSTLLITEADQLIPDSQDELANYLHMPTFELRILCTARTSLLDLAEQKKFRSDLAFALSTVVIEIPALRHRPKDIPLLAQHFVTEFNANSAKQVSGFVPEALDKLVRHEWKANLDELASVVEESCQNSDGTWITTANLPESMHAASEKGVRTAKKADDSVQLDGFLLEVERELIRRALQRTRGNKAKAARLLGISRPRLLRRILQLGLVKQEEVIEIPFEEVDEAPKPKLS